MTADEIRKCVLSLQGGEKEVAAFQFAMLREIAAQLAELNAHLEWVSHGGYIKVMTRHE